MCWKDAKNGDIRVFGINTDTFRVGHIEICKSQARAVCADGWDERAAMVACRQLFPESGGTSCALLMCHKQQILFQAMQQNFATTLALGRGRKKECQDLDAMGMKENFLNVELKQTLAHRMQECCVVSYTEKCPALSYFVRCLYYAIPCDAAGTDNSTCPTILLPGDLMYPTCETCKPALSHIN